MTHNFSVPAAGSGAGRPPARPRAVLVVCCAALALALLACTTSARPDASTPTTSLPGTTGVTVPEGFVVADTRGVAIAPFPGRAGSGTDAGVKGGAAEIGGLVTGPDGTPVPGATVQLERFVEDRVGVFTATTGPDGRYLVRDAHGGRYRVRAWLQPTLATTEPRVEFFVHDAKVHDIDFALQAFDGHLLEIRFDREAWSVDEVGLVSAVLSRQAVDGRGVVVNQGVPGVQLRLGLSGSADFAPGTAPLASTDGGGGASWRVQCSRQGSSRASSSSQVASAAVGLPVCGPRSQSTTTTTIAVPPFPVGNTFDVPFAGPVPPGGYRTFLSGCATAYEELVAGTWTPRSTTSNTIQLAGPGRGFRAEAGTDGCSYQRVS